MPIDLDKALGAALPATEYAWNEDTLMLYALGAGVGIGQDQTSPAVLQYTFENGLRALPTFGVVPSFPMLMGLMNVPALSFNPMMLLHGEQYLEVLETPIPTSATTRTEGKITGIYDKGKGALVVIEAVTTRSDGTPVFKNEFGIFLRGEGGFGGEAGPPVSNEPPARAPDAVVECPTLTHQALLYRLSGDKNPLHADPGFAKMGGFDKPILHGLCTYGFTGRALLSALCKNDPARFRSMEGRFSKPVFPGEAVTVKMWVDGNEAIFRTERQDGDIVIDQGRATFLA